MSWRDRPYAQYDYNARQPRRFGGFMGGMPRPGRVVGRLLIVNVVIFFLQIFPAFNAELMKWCTVIPAYWWQVWRYITFQFLHAGLFHILFNMIGLYFLGMMLEAYWGGRRFLVFYLGCGAVAGVAHVVMAFAMSRGMEAKLLGASGGVYGVVLACAVLFPQIRVIVFLFPMPIRTAAALFLGIAAFFTLQEIAAGGAMSGGVSHVAHLGGAAAAAVWIWVLPRVRMKLRFGNRPAGQGRWEKKLKRRQEQQEKIDRILDKIRREGIGSLSRGEKRTLQQTTEEMKNGE
ncbi:MAG: rhomboid family intramembrane serine protease [Planctomycetota bacterium]|nr:rhomboid family intramembrane serine protease [Planctomycetota bacterium]